MTRRIFASALCVASLLVAGATGCASAPGNSLKVGSVADDSPATYEFVVPLGTNELAERGEKISIIPNPFSMKVGEVIRIRNDDLVGYTIGPFYVGAKQTMTQMALVPGSYVGVCALHAGENLKVSIVPR
jgi:hypothetical protein